MQQPELKSKLQKCFDFLHSELLTIRTGRATPAILEDLKVNAYGTFMTLKELGSITAQDSQSLVVSPWDKSLISTIAKAIRDSDLNLNPVEEGDLLRVPVPALTEERRIELTKIVTKKVEEAKQSIRNVRQEAMKDIDNDFTNKAIGEDDKFGLKEDVEELAKDYTTKVEELGVSKKEDLLKI